MKGYERVLTSPLYSYTFARSVSGAGKTYGHLGFCASHLVYLYHLSSLTSQRGYHGHGHGHDAHGDDYYYGMDACVNPYPLF